MARAPTPPEETTAVGHSVRRLDGNGKVDGTALYVDDVPEPRAWHGATIRSTVAAGTLERIEWSGAFDWSRVVRVTAADLERLGACNAVLCIDDSQPVLVDREIRHAAEPVALVAAPDHATLLEALANVRLVETKRDAPTLTLSDAVDRDGEVMKAFKIEKGDALGQLQAAAGDGDLVVVEGSYATGHQEQMYIEPCGMVAEPLDNGGVRIRGSLQCPYYVQKALKHLFSATPDQIIVAQDVTGGGFGGKEEYPSMMGAHAALLAKAAGRPVKVVYDRTEDMVATTKRHPVQEQIRMGFRRDGTLVATYAEIEMDAGAYLTLTPVVLSRAILHAAGPYRCEHVLLNARARFTNTPPNGAFRGFGAPQTTWAYERLMDKAATVLGLDPVELRRKNRLVEGDVTATGQQLRWSVASTECMDAALSAANWEERRAAAARQREEAARNGDAKRRGVGFSLFFHGAGFTGAGEVRLKGRADVELQHDGRLRILAASTDIGQGVRTIFPQIAAEELGLPLDQVWVEDPRTDKVPDSGPTVASRSCMVVGKIIQEASRDLSAKICRGIEERHGFEAGSVERRGSDFFKKGADELVASWEAAATAFGGERGTYTYQHPEGIVFDESDYTGDAYPCFGWGADIVEVEVDTDTGEVAVTGCWTAHDVGKAINPMIVEGQLEGGVLQALGWALSEEVIMADGRMANARMTNYIIPTALDAPEMVTEVVESAYFYGPFGAKGCGELPMDGGAPAVAAAVEDAIGAHMTSLPMNPERVLAVLEETAGAAGKEGSG